MMNMIYAKTILILIFFSPVLHAVSQVRDSTNLSDTLTIPELGEIVITANRLGTQKDKTPEAIHLLDYEAIRTKQLRTAPEALTQTPGVFIQKTNHAGGSAFIRGLTGNQTLLLIDGIRLSNATMRYGPNQYLNTIDVFSIDRIEVLRGSGSVQYGTDALGGTIQAFTREPQFSSHPEFGGSMAGRAMTRGMERSLRADAHFGSEKLAVLGGITLRNFGDLYGGDTTGKQSPSGYREFDTDIKGKIRLSSFSTLTMAFQQVHQADIPVYHKIHLEDYSVNKTDPQLRNLAYLRMNRKCTREVLDSVTVTWSWQKTTEGRESLKNGAVIRRNETDKVNSLGFTAEGFLSKGETWSANSGIEIYHDIVFSNRIDKNIETDISTEKRGLYPDGATMTSMAVFSLHNWEVQKWILSAGARFNGFIIRISDMTLGQTTLTPSALVGNFAVMRKLGSSSNLFASINSGFRAPNIDDLGTLGVVDFRFEKPNFSLRPEHSLQYQIGYKLRGRRIRGEFFLYRNDLFDLIVRNPVPGDTVEGYPAYTKENVERAGIMGVESGFTIFWGRNWSARGTATYTHGQNITRDEPLRRIPPMFGQFALSYSAESLDLSFEWLAATKQDRLAAGDISDNRIPAGGTPGWNVINIHAGYTWKSFKLNLRLINLFDEDYRYHGSGINGYGRSALISLMVNL